LQFVSDLDYAALIAVYGGSSDSHSFQMGRNGSASGVKDVLSSVGKGQDALVLIWSNGGSTFRVLHAPGA